MSALDRYSTGHLDAMIDTLGDDIPPATGELLRDELARRLGGQQAIPGLDLE